MKNNHQGWFLAKLKLAALLKMSFSKYLFHERYLTFFTELLLMATSERTEAVVCKMFFKIDVPKNFANFTRKLLCWSLFLIKLQARPATLLKRDSNTVFLMNIPKFLITPLLQNSFGSCF